MKSIKSIKTQLFKKYPFADNLKINWDQFVLLAQELSRLYKFPSNITICQAALESGRGSSLIAKTKNNYFGFMAYDKDPGKAKKYATAVDSIVDYLELITHTPRYSAVAKCKTPLEKIELIHKCGYATDPLYVKKITSLKEWFS